MNMFLIFQKIFQPVLGFVWSVLSFTVGCVLLLATLYLFGFFCVNKINPFRRPTKATIRYLARLDLDNRLYSLLRWLIYDFYTRGHHSNRFKPYGFTLYVGRQGSGKTMSMVQHLNEYKARYPDCIIITNFKYKHADHIMRDWRELLEVRNGDKGVIFAIDEIHSEYSAESWKDFPETLLSEISQQRKQRIKIVATSQVFSRVAIQIREQCFSVVCCSTFINRLTAIKEYDAAEYATSYTPYRVKKRCKPLRRSWFVQSNDLRNCYDTYEKIERMQKIEFIKRGERH